MPATIARGWTFGSTELVTNTKLHTLVDAATISNLDETNLASGRGLVVRSTSAPSNTNCIWLDTNFTPPMIKLYDGANWIITQSSYGTFTNKSGGQRTLGDVVVPDTTTDSAFKTTTTANDIVLGVVMETIDDNATGVIALPGAILTALNVDATVVRGDRLAASATAGQATPSGANAFAIALSARTGAGAITAAVLINTVGKGTDGQVLTLASGLSAWGWRGIVQIVETSYRDNAAISAANFPDDDTPPLWNEGTEIPQLAVSITPKNASNILLIEFGMMTNTSGHSATHLALFDTPSGSDACISAYQYIQAASQSYPDMAGSYYFGAAGVTTQKTFKLRYGGNAYALNGDGANRKYGGKMYSFIRVTEIAPSS